MQACVSIREEKSLQKDKKLMLQISLSVYNFINAG